jgi:hypothetical protein
MGTSNGELRIGVERLIQLSNNGNQVALTAELMRLAHGSAQRFAKVGVVEENSLAVAAD